MKAKMTPIAYPTSQEEEYRWGFDIYKPDGVPRAWIVDWTSAGPGWGVSTQKAADILDFKLPEDLGQITADDLIAGLSLRCQELYNGQYKLLEDNLGMDKAIDVLTSIARAGGEATWKKVQARWSSPLSLEQVAWYQDAVHLLDGPTMRPHTWCDNTKVVCTREECTVRPLKGMESNAKYCMTADNSCLEGYMRAEPGMFCFKAPDLGELAQEPRCIHVWTYAKGVIEGLPNWIKERIPASTIAMFRERGANI